MHLNLVLSLSMLVVLTYNDNMLFNCHCNDLTTHCYLSLKKKNFGTTSVSCIKKH